jgi:hypothetical protein
MSDHTEDVRTKVSPEDHRVLQAISIATGEGINEITRRLLHDYCLSELRRHNVIAGLLKCEGGVGSAGE